MAGPPAAALLLLAAWAHAVTSSPFLPPNNPLSTQAPAPAPALSPWDGEELPAELLVSEFLFVNETKTYLFHKRKPEGPLSITVTPCTSSIAWSVSFRPDISPDSDAISSNEPAAVREKLLGEFGGKQLRSLLLPLSSGGGSGGGGAAPGAYVLRVRALERDSFVQLFASLRHTSGIPVAAGSGSGGTGGPLLPAPTRTRTRLWLRRRRRPGNRLTVRWESSQVDPHLIRYCLVVNPRRHYSTLCEARGELLSAGAAAIPDDADPATTPTPAQARRKLRKDVKPFKKDKGKGRPKGRKGAAGDVGATVQPHDDIIIGCVGKRTQYTVSGLKPGRLYRFDLFAVHRPTNLSVPYGSAEMRFDARARPTALRDGRAASVNLKSLDGRATFRFKDFLDLNSVGLSTGNTFTSHLKKKQLVCYHTSKFGLSYHLPQSASELIYVIPKLIVPRLATASGAASDVFLYVMPCGGGAVNVRAHLQPPPPPTATANNASSTAHKRAALSQEVARARVEGYAALRVPAPAPGSRLVLRVAAPNAEEQRRVSALEVMATTRPERFPFPTLPWPARLHEYDSLRRCDSVTVGWLPSAAPPGWASNTSIPSPASPSSRGAPPATRLRYCVAAREARARDLEAGRRADQCGLDQRMRREASARVEVPVRVCSEQETTLVEPPPLAEIVERERQPGTTARSTRGSVTTLALGKLRPGRAYTVQLTVQRLPGGRPLSYDLLPVHTKPSCA